MQNRSHEKNRKNEGPVCACGRGDLYEEWLKNEKEKKEASEATPPDHTEDSINPSSSADKDD